MNVVIYARFSSHSQTEQSIEGQLKECYTYAERMGYTVVGEYIDRAQSGKFDNRTDFQKMIADSEKHTFQGVLVYQLDRFARNRYDSAIYKAKLKKNGVRVLSARENITDDASGILIEGVLESMAEYYSAELAQKIHRGMLINAEKCLSNGSNPGLGFKVNKDRTFSVDEEGAKIVREIFERYARGETKAEIVKDLQQRKIKTSLGNVFTYNSLSHLLENKRYIGVYMYKDMETPGGMPRIVDDDLFYKVQDILNKNKVVPARTRGENEYLLTTKLFCGYCKEMMVGYGGTGKSGKQYHYYMCRKARKKQCDKKMIKKEYIEDRIVKECLKMLTEDKIQYIAEKIAEECSKNPDNISVKEIKNALKEVDLAIENLWKGIEKGQAVEMLTERLHKRQAEKAELEERLAIENNKKVCLSEAQILAFLDYICEMPLNDLNKRRAIINIFVHSIYLYDGYFTLIINASKKPLNIENIPFDDIEAAFDAENCDFGECSSLQITAPPNIEKTLKLCGFKVFLLPKNRPFTALEFCTKFRAFKRYSYGKNYDEKSA
ncbi:MAG: recombinase family protein [Oscillospiraceae bacterium]|nr:recombinase family protein [Oscillospiraceae bacterium]